MKRFNRHKNIASGLLVVSFIISALVLINAVEVIVKVYIEDKGINRFSYSSVYWVKPIGNVEYDDKDCSAELIRQIISAMKKSKCNVSFYNVPINIDDQIDNTFVELVINSPTNMKLISNCGSDIEIVKQNGTNSSFIGESILETTGRKKIGDNFIVDDYKIVISDILENYSPAGLDNSFIMFWDYLEPDFSLYLEKILYNRLKEQTLQVHFFSDNEIENDVVRFVSTIESYGLSCTSARSYLDLGYWGTDTRNLWYRAYNILLLPLCIFFALLNCFSSSFIWTLSRKKEFAIRKAFGYNNFKLFLLVLKDELILSIPSFIVASGIQIIMNSILQSHHSFGDYFIYEFILICLGLLIFSLLCAIKQIGTINRIDLTKILKTE